MGEVSPDHAVQWLQQASSTLSDFAMFVPHTSLLSEFA
jgi:hypothetical protein